MTPEGLCLFQDKFLHCEFFTRVPTREKDFMITRNKLIKEGRTHTLAVMLHSAPKPAGWYIALHKGSTSPNSETLTAATYTATMDEITSTAEGYSNLTRPQYVVAAPTTDMVNNYDNRAVFNIATATVVSATGLAVLSSDIRGGTSGVIWSAAQFPQTRQLYDGEPFEAGYQTSLADDGIGP